MKKTNKIPKAFNIVLTDTRYDGVPTNLNISMVFSSIKYVSQEKSVLIPATELLNVTEVIRHQKALYKSYKYEHILNIYSVDTFEGYCKYISDNLDKQKMVSQAWFKKLSKGKTKRKHIMYLKDCVDFLLEQGIRGTPWRQTELHVNSGELIQ